MFLSKNKNKINKNKNKINSEIQLQDYNLCIYERAEWVKKLKAAIKEVKDKYE